MRPTPDKGEGPAAKRRRMNQYQSEQCSDNKDSNEKDKTEYTGILVWEDQWLADSLPSERLPSLGVQYCCYHDGKGYYYHQTMEFGNIRYLACAEVMCPVKASMNTQKEAPIIVSGLRMGHNHRPDYMLREALLFVDAVRIRTRSGMSISSAISLEIVRNPAGAERVNLINLKNCLEECAMLSQSKNKDMTEDEVNFASCLIHVKTFKLNFSTESLIPVPNHFDSAICTLDDPVNKDDEENQIPGPFTPVENEEYRREAINIKTPCQNQAVEKEEIVTVKIEENDCDEYMEEVYIKEERLDEIPGPSTPVENEEYRREVINIKTPCQNQAVEKEIITVKIEDNDCDEYTEEVYLKEERLEEIPGPSAPVENEEYRREAINIKTPCQNQVEKEIITVKIEDNDCDEYTEEVYLKEERLEEIPGPSAPVENEEYRREAINIKTPCQNQAVEKEIITVKIEDNDCDEYTEEVYLKEERLEEIPGPSTPVENEEFHREVINKKTHCQNQAVEKEIITVKIEDIDSDEYTEEEYLKEERLEEYFEEEIITVKKEENDSDEYTGEAYLEEEKLEEIPGPSAPVENEENCREDINIKTPCQNQTVEKEIITVKIEDDDSDEYTDEVYLEEEKLEEIPGPSTPVENEEFRREDLNKKTPFQNQAIEKEIITVKIEDDDSDDSDEYTDEVYLEEEKLEEITGPCTPVENEEYRREDINKKKPCQNQAVEKEIITVKIEDDDTDDSDEYTDEVYLEEEKLEETALMKSQVGESRSRREMNQVGLYPAEKLYSRNHGIIYYNGEGYYYKTNRTNENKWYLGCTEPKCMARGFIQLDKEDAPIIPSGHIHNHEPNYSKRDLLVFIHRCKERAARELHLNVRHILESELERDGNISALITKTYKKRLEAQMKRYRILYGAFPDEFPQPKATSVPKKDGSSHGGLAVGVADNAPSFNQQVYRIGDFVYAEPKERGMDPILLNIQRLWTNQEGQQMLYGNQYYRPKETYHVTTRTFLEKEVFKTNQHVAIPLNQVLGRCCVLSVKDYFRSRPDNFEEKDVYVCDSRYSSEARRAFKKIKNWPQSLTAGYKLLPRDQVLEPKRVMFDVCV
ncbi:uncharacterized protein LOC129001948 isoform X2 [Macrosteles quadrilineatus]|uniref:uncharacterized protein LOC129001948 isoform X2 n=1 Tax=Macrosteles quadrilineatus TaxID=74068 RepID=UPI0023E2A7F9|nr:uncharacterized protein LOC129001948 isoform X2 [Macrosteles quadrilineatus]